MRKRVTPIYGNGWFDVIQGSPVSEPDEFLIEVISADNSTVRGIVASEDHDFYNLEAILTPRWSSSDQAMSYNVRLCKASKAGEGDQGDLFNGYAQIDL